MNKLNAIGVDLAKNVIQVSVLSPSNRELRNSALTRRKLPSSSLASVPAWWRLKPVRQHTTGPEPPSDTVIR